MYHSIRFRSMNTDVSAILWDKDSKKADLALKETESFFNSMHNRFTRFETESELYALNNSRGKSFKASKELFEVVELAVCYYKISNGLFNPAIIDALEAAGYDRSFEKISSSSLIEKRISVVPSCDGIMLNPDLNEIMLPGHVRIDLGGIAKGWTVQKAAERLSEHGACLVNAGGDIMTLGTVPGATDWKVDIADPVHPDHKLFALTIHEKGIATSGTNKRRWRQQGVINHHIIDPRTGLPSQSDIMTVTLIGKNTTEAEVFAKLVFLLGSTEGLRYVNHNHKLAACIVTTTGKIIYSDEMVQYIYE